MPSDNAAASHGSFSGLTALHLALAFTTLAFAVHKTKKDRTDATRLTESLWGIKFQPLTARGRGLLTALSALALLALLGHSLGRLGPGGAFFVLGLVGIVLRKAGIFRVALAFVRSGGQVPLTVGRPRASDEAPLPVWVLTGFLGSGKTTLVNRLLRTKLDGRSLLVVENEVGATTLDAELVVQACGRPEQVLLVNDGCACCKIQGDLCDLLRDDVLGRRASKHLDVAGVVIECSGLADPRAVVQTFLLDDDISSRLELREVVAVVDAANVGRHLQPGDGQRTSLTRLVEEQIAFASLVLINKIDRAPRGQTVEELVKSVGEVNRTAEILRCTYCDVEPTRVLNRSGFNRSVGAWSPDRALLEIERVHVEIGVGTKDSGAVEQESDILSDQVRCVSVRIDGELDLDAFNRWVVRTLSEMDILRAKGVLAVAGRAEKLAFQAVHASFDGTPALGSRWRPGEPRFSEVVVIGCGLQPNLLEIGLRRCLA